MQNYKEELEKQIQEIDALIAQIDNNTLRVKNLSKCGIAISKSNGPICWNKMAFHTGMNIHLC